MPISKQWPSGGTNPVVTSYNIPLNNELNWTQLSSFLQALADSAQGTSFQKFAARVGVTSPIAVSATTDCVVVSNLTVAGPVAVTLPAGAAKQVFIIVDGKGDAGTNNITITPNGAETIKGAATLVLSSNYTGVVLVFTGTNWNCFGPFLAPGQVTPADFVGILPVSKGGTGISSFGAGVATWLGTPSSANLASAVTDETGSGALVFANSPTLVTPALGTPSALVLTSATGLPIDGGTINTLPITRGGTGQITANAALNALLPSQAGNAGEVLTTDGTDASWAAALTATLPSGQIFVGNAGNVATAVTPTGDVTISNTGATSLGTNLTVGLANGSVTSPSMNFTADADGSGTGIYRIGANNLGFSANGINVGQYSSSGKWTIGATGSTENHAVNGSFAFSEQAGLNAGAMIWRDTSDRLRMNFDGGMLLANDADSTTFGAVSSAGKWTLGTNSGSFVGNDIYGRKDASAISSGFVGEVLEATAASAVNFSSDITNGGFSFGSGSQLTYYLLYVDGTVGNAAAKLTVTPGVWRIEGGIRWSAGANAFTTMQVFLFNTSSAAGAAGTPYSGTWAQKPDSGTSAVAQGDTTYGTITTNISASTTYYLYMFYVGNASTLGVESCWIKAIRIA